MVKILDYAIERYYDVRTPMHYEFASNILSIIEKEMTPNARKALSWEELGITIEQEESELPNFLVNKWEPE